MPFFDFIIISINCHTCKVNMIFVLEFVLSLTLHYREQPRGGLYNCIEFISSHSLGLQPRREPDSVRISSWKEEAMAVAVLTSRQGTHA